MFGLGFPELILILVIALIIFGPGKLPEVGKAIGKSVREFKKATNEIKQEFELEETPSQAQTHQANQSTSSLPNSQVGAKNPYTTVFDENKESASTKEVNTEEKNSNS